MYGTIMACHGGAIMATVNGPVMVRRRRPSGGIPALYHQCWFAAAGPAAPDHHCPVNRCHYGTTMACHDGAMMAASTGPAVVLYGMLSGNPIPHPKANLKAIRMLP